MAKNKQYVITHELESTGLRRCCFIADNHGEAVVYIEKAIADIQIKIRDDNFFNKANGNENDNKKITDISRFGYVEGGYANVWTITIEHKGKVEHEYFYLYNYEKERDEWDEDDEEEDE